MRKLPIITRKSLLYKSGVEYTDYCINHVEGCSHGCRFPCYAMMMAMRSGRIKGYQDWIKPKLVGNALELLEKEIPRHKHKIKFVHLCFSTDPFMYQQPEVIEMTLKILARLHKDNIRCTLLTKGIYPEELLDKTTYGKDNEYGITLISLDDEFKRRFEPYSASYPQRIAGLRKLHEAGFKTWVSIEPYPTPNIVVQDLNKILSAVSFVDKIIFGKWNYSRLSSEYKGREQYYDNCAEIVTSFCKRENINCHIKFGTRTSKKHLEGELQTEKLFN